MVSVFMSGQAPAEQVAGLLVALRARGETGPELAGMAEAMREKMIPVDVDADAPLIDTCGTGGDGAHTFNVSTTAAIVAATGGARVAKHGNRAVSSRCGSADVLEALGVPWDLGPKDGARCLKEVGITFLFAPRHHPATRSIATVRRALGVRTAMNLLGPLCNPAGVRRQTIGVSSRDSAERMVSAVVELGCEHVWVLCGDDGAGGVLDEISPCGPTAVWEIRGATVTQRSWEPEALGLICAPIRALRGGDAAENAAAIESVLAGEPGPRGDAVALNAGAAFVVAGIDSDLSAGFVRARDILSSGTARATLDRWRAFGAAQGGEAA